MPNKIFLNTKNILANLHYKLKFSKPLTLKFLQWIITKMIKRYNEDKNGIYLSSKTSYYYFL